MGKITILDHFVSDIRSFPVLQKISDHIFNDLAHLWVQQPPSKFQLENVLKNLGAGRLHFSLQRVGLPSVAGLARDLRT